MPPTPIFSQLLLQELCSRWDDWLTQEWETQNTSCFNVRRHKQKNNPHKPGLESKQKWIIEQQMSLSHWKLPVPAGLEETVGKGSEGGVGLALVWTGARLRREPDGGSPTECDWLCSLKTINLPSRCPELRQSLLPFSVFFFFWPWIYFNVNFVPANGSEPAVFASRSFIWSRRFVAVCSFVGKIKIPWGEIRRRRTRWRRLQLPDAGRWGRLRCRGPGSRYSSAGSALEGEGDGEGHGQAHRLGKKQNSDVCCSDN